MVVAPRFTVSTERYLSLALHASPTQKAQKVIHLPRTAENYRIDKCELVLRRSPLSYFISVGNSGTKDGR